MVRRRDKLDGLASHSQRGSWNSDSWNRTLRKAVLPLPHLVRFRRTIMKKLLILLPSDWGPSLTKYRYVYSGDRVMLVDPATRTVVQEVD